MDAIAQRTGSSKTVFYRYFGDRNGLQDAVGEWAITVIGRHLAQASERPDRLRAMVAAFVDLAAGSPAVYTFAAGSTPVAGGGRQSETMLAGVRALLLEAARPAGLDEVAAQEWAAGAIGFVRGCVDAWLAEAPSEQDRRREAEALADRITTWLSMTITAPGAASTTTEGMTPDD